MSIDLHVHTNFSDGTDSPEDIIKKAEEFIIDSIATKKLRTQHTI